MSGTIKQDMPYTGVKAIGPQEPATIIEIRPPLKVKVTRRKSNRSGDILVTVNRDQIVIVNGKSV